MTTFADLHINSIRFILTECGWTDWNDREDKLVVDNPYGSTVSLDKTMLRLYASNIDELMSTYGLDQPTGVAGRPFANYLERYLAEPRSIQNQTMRRLLLLKKALEQLTVQVS